MYVGLSKGNDAGVRVSGKEVKSWDPMSPSLYWQNETFGD